MLRAFKYKINPTKEQTTLLNKHIGASRFVYNLALECKQMAWAGNRVNLSCFALHSQLKDLKTECEWLKEINSQSLQQSITNLDKAYTAFFKGQNSFPKFKKKSNGGSFNIPQNVLLENGKLIIPKFKKGIDIILHRPIKGVIRQATISRTPTGKYFVSILCETGEAIKPKAKVKEKTTVGIKLNILPSESFRHPFAKSALVDRSNGNACSPARSTTTVPYPNNFTAFFTSLSDFLTGSSPRSLMKFGYMFNGTFCPLVGFRYFSFCFSRVGFSEKSITFSNSGFGMVRNSNAFGLRSFPTQSSSMGFGTNIIAEFLFAAPEERNPKTFSILKVCAVTDNFKDLEAKSIPSVFSNGSIKWKVCSQVPFSSVFCESKSNIDGLPNIAFSVDCVSKNIDSRNIWNICEPCFHTANIQQRNDLTPKTVKKDLGIKTYLVSSDGQEFDNPKFLRKAQIRLKYVQRKYSKHKGKRTKQRLAILHEKVTNQRKDFLHKTSSELIKNHDSLAIEDLAVSNMVKNHNLAQAISDASWSTFVTMLEYKAEWYGKNILKIGRFEPSSKLHANCGYINKDLKLSDREWFCPKCGELVSRDVNAAINIKSFALKNILSGTDRKNHDELPTLVGVMTHEAHPIASGVGG